MKKTALACLLFMLGAPLFMLTTGCANMIPPTGGPRDTLPPVMMTVNPKDSVLRFAGKKIVFQFDEYVQLTNTQQQLIVSPTPKVMPVVENKLRTITVTLKDTLEENTTYRIDFGNAISDINENNIIRDFSYIFSTGNYLDSLELNGAVQLAENGAVDSTLIVMLYSDLTDSAVVKERPRYVTRLSREGTYTFHNLRPGKYALYTLKDEGGARRYSSPAQLFGFADEPITIPFDGNAPTLRAYIDSAGIELTEEKPLTGAKPANDKDRRMKFDANLENNQLELKSDLVINFRPIPYKTLDSSKIQLTDEKFNPIAASKITGDTAGRHVTIQNTWAEGTAYNLILQKDFATDTTGRQLLRTDTLSFRTKTEKDYGNVRLRFPGLDMSKNPIVQFIQAGKVVRTEPLSTNEFNDRLFNPGEYEMRIYFDTNKNGKWDSGEFFGIRKQPEQIIPIPRKLTIKANWDNQVDVRLDASDKPVQNKRPN
ncbi:MAG TPA: Ig-like domain-containing protein [Flavitalea sp.]|nr:Ig-like domain-containing protein [Flavitalea sp.]